MEIKKLIKLEKYCEDTQTCPICNSFSLIGCNPDDLLFMCSNCGNYFGYNEEEDKIIEINENDK